MDGPHWILFLILACVDVADVTSDWLFYTDVSLTKTGLVYGTPDAHAVQGLLVCSCIGTILFFLELLNLAYEFCKDYKRSPCVDADILSFFSVWLVDVTQMIISLSLAMNSEEKISGFQLSKAIVVLISICVRLAISCVKSSNKQAHRHQIFIKASIVVGGVIELVCAGVIFGIANSARATASSAVVVVNETYQDNSYFTRVGVFMNMPEYFDTGYIDPENQESVVNLVQLTSVTRIRASSDLMPVTFSFQYEKNGADSLKMAIWKKDETWMPPNCYVIHQSSGSATPEATATCESKGYFGNASIEAFLKFRFEPPGDFYKKRVFGQIFFNMKILESGECSGIDAYSDVVRLTARTPVTLAMHYYRANQGDGGYFVDGPKGPRFFRNDPNDLTDVADVWTMGLLGRRTTGSLGPVLDRGLDLECSRA